MTEAPRADIGPVRIEIVSDVMCPWCYIGKRNLEVALRGDPDLPATSVGWLPFQLDPTLPPGGKDRQQYLAEKFGADRAAAFYERIGEVGQAAGIAFDFDAMRVSPNTFDAHRLIALAGQIGEDQQNTLVEALFRAFFTEGRNIGERDVLADIVEELGVARGDTLKFLDSDELATPVRNMLESIRAAGIAGVPHFIFDRRIAVSGAQPPDVLRGAIFEVARSK